MRDIGAYIHIPWCVSRCGYCDFNAHVAPGKLPVRQYVDALIADMDETLKHPHFHRPEGRVITTIFFGGGTPSLFPASAIGEILTALRARFDVAANAEVTMEANPSSALTPEAYREAGVTRLSIGVQSLQPSQLHTLERAHGPEEALRCIDGALSAGFDSVNVDLMYGLPDQTAASAQADLEGVLATGVPHVSWYQLTIERNTPFWKLPLSLPGDDSMDAIEEIGHRTLRNARLESYEISAWCQPNHECRHNLTYWNFRDYIGLGAGAHGKLSARGDIVRTVRYRRPATYMNATQKMTSQAHIPREERISEFMMNALRLNAPVDIAGFEESTGFNECDLLDAMKEPIAMGLWDSKANTPSALGIQNLDDLLGMLV